MRTGLYKRLSNEAAVVKYEEEHKQPIPADYFRPSSMYGCERMLYFMRTGEEQDKEEHDINLMEICHSGTDRHLRIQHLVESMEGVKTLDLEEMVKEAQAKGVNTDFVGWNEDHTEARCKNDELSIWFQPDGVLNFMGKDVILEIKTESTYQHSKRYEPKMDHKYQATCYGLGLGIDYILFFYEDRNFCTLGKSDKVEDIRYDYFNLDDGHIFKDHEPLIAAAPHCTDHDHFYYKEKKLSFTKTEDVYKRSLQAAKKGKTLTFHWRGGYLTREVLNELLRLIRKVGEEKNKTAVVNVNWPQAVLRLHYTEAQMQECITMEDANEGEKE